MITFLRYAYYNMNFIELLLFLSQMSFFSKWNYKPNFQSHIFEESLFLFTYK